MFAGDPVVSLNHWYVSAPDPGFRSVEFISIFWPTITFCDAGDAFTIGPVLVTLMAAVAFAFSPEMSVTVSVTLYVPALLNAMMFPFLDTPALGFTEYEYMLLPVPP